MNAVVTPAVYVDDPLPTFEQVAQEPFPFLLESAARSEPFARYSFLSSSPYQVLCLWRGELKLFAGNDVRRLNGDPFDALHALVQRVPVKGPSELPFLCGGVGYLAYDLKHRIEMLPEQAVAYVDVPDLLIGFYDHLLCFDHAKKQAFRIELSERFPPAMDSNRYLQEFGNHTLASDPRVRVSFASNFTREDYLGAVRRAKDYILAGDIYEVNLSQRFTAEDPLPPLEVYRRLRQSSPAWYSSLVMFGSRALLSASPEEFLSIRGRTIRTRPIKGTRRRGKSPQEDEFFKDELWTSEKDDAELAMIVDLERNDLGRVCQFGTVVVREPKLIETHASVLHLSATVEGQLRADATLGEILRATFPGGSVTGAPKIRAMEIIDELEPTRRGPYTGAIGYFGYNGQSQLAMAIRTTLSEGHRYHYQAGGAIVADSDPEGEFEETLVKAAPFRKIFGIH